MQQGMDYADIPELLNFGKLSTEERDVALFYGIKVLFLLSQQTSHEDVRGISIPNLTPPSKQLSEDPQMLVCSHPEFFPLFKNLNCISTGYQLEAELMSEAINEKLSIHPSISLVLLVDSSAEEQIDFIRKHTPHHILVSTLNLQTESFNGPTFFDTIVRQTLGIRLTEDGE
jgi:hypothetical protein